MNLEKTNLASLTEIEPVIAGRRLSPFSVGRLQLCRQAGLKIVTREAGTMPQSEIELELLAFYFIHAFPLEEVRAACAKPREQFFREHIEPLSFDFPAREIPRVLKFLEGEFSAVEGANVEAVERGGGHPGEAAPPNT